jgi:hypothetical protein
MRNDQILLITYINFIIWRSLCPRMYTTVCTVFITLHLFFQLHWSVYQFVILYGSEENNLFADTAALLKTPYLSTLKRPVGRWPSTNSSIGTKSSSYWYFWVDGNIQRPFTIRKTDHSSMTISIGCLTRTFSTGPKEKCSKEPFSAGSRHQLTLKCATGARRQQLDSPWRQLSIGWWLQPVLSGEIVPAGATSRY